MTNHSQEECFTSSNKLNFLIHGIKCFFVTDTMPMANKRFSAI